MLRKLQFFGMQFVASVNRYRPKPFSQLRLELLCRLSDDPVVADVKRRRNNVAVGGLARVSDSVSQHSVKLALAEFLG